MLAKWWWRFHNEGNALWCKLIRSIHGQSGDSNTTLPLKSKSWTWYHIVSIKNDLLNLGIDMSLIFKKKIGNRTDTRAPTFHQHHARTSDRTATVTPAIDSQIGPSASQVGLVYNWSWLRLIRAGSNLTELEDLYSLVAHLRLFLNQDIWECTIDNSILPSKVNILTWRIVNLRLPTRVNLDCRGIDLDSIRCPICDAAIETENHIFTECELSKSTWNRVLEWWGIQNINITNINDVIRLANRVHLPATTVKIFDSVVQTTLWVLWRFRNEANFAIKHPNKDLIINDIKCCQEMGPSEQIDMTSRQDIEQIDLTTDKILRVYACMRCAAIIFVKADILTRDGSKKRGCYCKGILHASGKGQEKMPKFDASSAVMIRKRYYYNKVTEQSKSRIPDELKLAREQVETTCITIKYEPTKDPDNDFLVPTVGGLLQTC
ncbi:RNA-directed DNA polymerase, eukaryota, reverse transcriptase zinc-binding domain protein [Tanacetum coccineum]